MKPLGLCLCAAVLVAAGIGVAAGCGGGQRLSDEEFSSRVQSIGRRGSERWARLAERAGDLKPGQTLPVDVVQAVNELVEFQRQAIGELEELEPPDDAEIGVGELIEALSRRTDAFAQVIEAGRFTQRQFDQITQAGEKIDDAFALLRKEGFLPAEDEHDD